MKTDVSFEDLKIVYKRMFEMGLFGREQNPAAGWLLTMAVYAHARRRQGHGVNGGKLLQYFSEYSGVQCEALEAGILGLQRRIGIMGGVHAVIEMLSRPEGGEA